MITHDVDEAIYLADRIVLMTNGPGAVMAEIVDNPLPKDRKRADFHKHPLYYGVRNHIIDFLVTRSRNFAEESKGGGFDRRHVPVVRPGAPEPRWQCVGATRRARSIERSCRGVSRSRRLVLRRPTPAQNGDVSRGTGFPLRGNDADGESALSPSPLWEGRRAQRVGVGFLSRPHPRPLPTKGRSRPSSTGYGEGVQHHARSNEWIVED